ncbi:hypothetical protein CEQ90_13745 [Lewinellaceae bacterium SD302]|nr:hypothetical protein CEQ90_13745 [Lewinellaceae bacterium SD302]
MNYPHLTHKAGTMKSLLTLLPIVLLITNSLSAQIETVATGVNFIQDVDLDQDGILYAADVDTVIHFVDLDQSIPANLSTYLITENPRGLAVIDDYLYFTTDGDISIVRVPLNDPAAEPETVIDELPPGTPLEFLAVNDRAYVAFVNTLDNGGIYRFELGQPFPQQLDTVITGFPVSGMAFYEGELYFTYFNSLPIRKIDPNQSNPTPETVVPELVGPNGLTVVGDYLYISTESTISRFDLSAPLPALQAIATDLSLPSRMAFDGTNYLYFGEGNRLARLPIPLEVNVTELGESDASIYPNPTGGMVYLKNISLRRAIISDSFGRRVLVVSAHRGQLDLSGLIPGVYGFLLETTDGRWVSGQLSKF